MFEESSKGVMVAVAPRAVSGRGQDSRNEVTLQVGQHWCAKKRSGLEFEPAAAGDGGADGEIGAGAIAVEQHLEGGEAGHEERRAGLAGQGPQGGGGARAEGQVEARAPVTRQGRPRPIEGQLQGGEAVELGLPVVELRLEPRPGDHWRCQTA